MEFIWELKYSGDIRRASVVQYTFSRETPHYYVVMCRGSEKWIKKERFIFTSEEALIQAMQQLKQMQLEAAQRAAEELSKEISVSCHEVPADRYSEPKEGIPL